MVSWYHLSSIALLLQLAMHFSSFGHSPNRLPLLLTFSFNLLPQGHGQLFIVLPLYFEAPPSTNASPMQALLHSASFWPESSVARWSLARRSELWSRAILASLNLTSKLLIPIECVHLTLSNSQIQNRRATKGFILIGHKRYQIYTCLQLSSSIAPFVWKPAHFELRSYGGAWHNTKIAFVEKYTLISWFLTILGV